MRTPFVVGNWKLHKTIPEAYVRSLPSSNISSAWSKASRSASRRRSRRCTRSRAGSEDTTLLVRPRRTPLGSDFRRVDRRGLGAPGRRCRRDLGDRRPQRAPPVLRRHDRRGRQEGARGARGRARRDRVRRRDADGARSRPHAHCRRRSARRRARHARVDRYRRLQQARRRLRAGVGDRHRPHRDARAGAGSPSPHLRAAARRALRAPHRPPTRSASNTAARSRRATPRR